MQLYKKITMDYFIEKSNIFHSPDAFRDYLHNEGRPNKACVALDRLNEGCNYLEISKVNAPEARINKIVSFLNYFLPHLGSMAYRNPDELERIRDNYSGTYHYLDEFAVALRLLGVFIDPDFPQYVEDTMLLEQGKANAWEIMPFELNVINHIFSNLSVSADIWLDKGDNYKWKRGVIVLFPFTHFTEHSNTLISNMWQKRNEYWLEYIADICNLWFNHFNLKDKVFLAGKIGELKYW